MEETRQIHLARKTVQLGVFDPEAVTVGLANGRFQTTDLAWTNGMAAWKPLGEWPEFAAVASAAVPPLPADVADAADAAPLAWEQAKGVSSAWVSFKEIVLRPSPTLAASRLQLGSVVPLAWVLAAISGFSSSWVGASMPTPTLRSVISKACRSWRPLIGRRER